MKSFEERGNGYLSTGLLGGTSVMDKYPPNSFIVAEGLFYGGILQDIQRANNPLQPIFEAFTNSIEAIRLKDKENDSGIITIKLYSVDPNFKNLLCFRAFTKSCFLSKSFVIAPK